MQKCAHKYPQKVKSGGQAGAGVGMGYPENAGPSGVIIEDE